MIKLMKSRMLIISFILSGLFHTGFLVCMYLANGSQSSVQEETPVYKAGLEYVYTSMDNQFPENKNQPGKKRQMSKVMGTKKPEKENPVEVLQDSFIEKKYQPGPEKEYQPEPEKLRGKDELTGTYHSGKNNEFTITNYSGENNEISAGHPAGYSEEGNYYEQRDFTFIGLQDKIKENILYPPLARKRGMEGTTIVFFSIDREGELLKSDIYKSSGHSILDKAALELIDRVLPYPHPLGKTVEMKISVVFDLQ